MGDPFTVVILVAAGGAADPTTYAVERAASAALGRSARVLVREAAAAPTDGEALAAAPEGPGAVVEMSWSDRAHHAAVLRVRIMGSEAGNETGSEAGSETGNGAGNGTGSGAGNGTGSGAGNGRWLDRTIGFGPNDKDTERARTLGFALASMIPDADASAPREETPAPSASSAPGAPPEMNVDRVPPETSGVADNFALDMFAVGAAGVGAAVQTAGAGGALEAFLTSPFALRFGGAVMAGSLSAARGSVLTLMGTGGVAVHPWRPTRAHPLGASFRLDYVIVSQSLSHDSPSGATSSTRSRALSGADVFADFEWQCAQGVEVLLGAGIEEMFATTYVDLNGLRVATLPPTSALAEAGLRLPF
jgi:hypothetical protein